MDRERNRAAGATEHAPDPNDDGHGFAETLPADAAGWEEATAEAPETRPLGPDAMRRDECAEGRRPISPVGRNGRQV